MRVTAGEDARETQTALLLAIIFDGIEETDTAEAAMAMLLPVEVALTLYEVAVLLAAGIEERREASIWAAAAAVVMVLAPVEILVVVAVVAIVELVEGTILTAVYMQRERLRLEST